MFLWNIPGKEMTLLMKEKSHTQHCLNKSVN